MGDTDIFSDMALINELHEPAIGIVPVGDHFTMGGAVAALACRRFFKFETVIPGHYATFPMLDQTPEKFVAAWRARRPRCGFRKWARRSRCRSQEGGGTMRILTLAAAAAILVTPSAASAADDFIKGVYLQTEELCAQARKETLQTVIEAGNVILTGERSGGYRIRLRIPADHQGDAIAGLARACGVPGARLSVPGCPLGPPDELDTGRAGVGQAGRPQIRRRQWRQLLPLQRRRGA